MKRITFLLATIIALVFTLNAADKPANDSTGITMSKEALLTRLAKNAVELEQKFYSNLTLEQRQTQDAQKATVVQYNTIKAILAMTDSTVRVSK